MNEWTLNEDEEEECPSCCGLGYHDVGDCEDGVIEECPQCNGEGRIPNE